MDHTTPMLKERHRPDPAAPLFRYPAPESRRVRVDAPARMVMTDLRAVRPVTIGPEASIAVALELMIQARVRLLLVLDGEQVIGLVSARELMGERPVAVATRNRSPRDEVTVGEVMTPRAELDLLTMDDVDHGRVRDIMLMLRERGHQHAMVVEQTPSGAGYYTRGIFSLTQIGRQLGVELAASDRATSFADIEHLIADTVVLGQGDTASRY